jgi:beta-lactamase class A
MPTATSVQPGATLLSMPTMPTLTGPPSATPTTPRQPDIVLADGIKQTMEESGGEWHILIKQVNGNIIYSQGSNDRIPIASVVKVPIAMLFFKSLEKSGVSPDQYLNYLATYGIGRSYQQLLEAMLIDSEEDATNTLLENIRTRGLNIGDALENWRVNDLDIISRYGTVQQIEITFEGLYAGNFIPQEARASILNLMSTYTPNDDTRLGVIRPLLPAGAEFYNKRGTITEQFLSVDDCAIVVVPGDHGKKAFVVTVFSFGGNDPANATTDIKLTLGIEQIARLLADYINSTP